MSFFTAVLAIALVPLAVIGGRGQLMLATFAGALLLVQALSFSSVLRAHRNARSGGVPWMSITGMVAAAAAMVLALNGGGGC